ncbi:Sodium/proton antiporter ChaA [Methyloligella halotolerans]|uniref:Sodium/proton antiporter ChaA n=1 Tax=Methyloligella halotolerans TaxID=1177755 RepID=A0A1E2S3M4_9HYPH|nr:calcium:proton antiporter [Methyloligella halotolerans]ODA69041.1 Sodium/proton antiporter ChaA [Methyloligella halotolerans]
MSDGGPAAVGIGTVVAMVLFGDALLGDLSNYFVTSITFLWLFVVMVWCAFGVLRHAEAVAVILGEPYGTLVLTVAVTVIEVTLLVTIMLHGESNPTLARDTMFATLMLVLNGMIGGALLIGGLRYHTQEYNLEGARAFLVVLAPLAVFSLIVPNYTETVPDPSRYPGKAIIFALIAAAFYSIFLAIQTTRHQSFFAQPVQPDLDADGDALEPVIHETESHGLLFHIPMLLVTLLPIVILAEYLAVIIDLGIEKKGLPEALGGIVVALIVLTPEGLTAMRAAAANKLQRSVNVCLGSALATLGLTIPAVLAVGIVAHTDITLGLTGLETVLLVLTLGLAALTFGGVRTTVLQGLVHLLMFACYLVLVFSP